MSRGNGKVTETGDGSLGCGGVIILIIIIIVVIGALSSMGADTSRWDCPGEPTPCQEER